MGRAPAEPSRLGKGPVCLAEVDAIAELRQGMMIVNDDRHTSAPAGLPELEQDRPDPGLWPALASDLQHPGAAIEPGQPERYRVAESGVGNSIQTLDHSRRLG